jgi:hypothetical protein
MSPHPVAHRLLEPPPASLASHFGKMLRLATRPTRVMAVCRAPLMRAVNTRADVSAAQQMPQQYRDNAEGKLLQHLSKVAAKCFREGKLDESNEMYHALVKARRERHGDRHPLTLRAVGALSGVAQERGDHQLAESLAREASSTSRELLGVMHPDSLQQLSNLASVLSSQGKLGEAEHAAREAVEGFKLVFGESDRQFIEAKLLLERCKQSSSLSPSP